MTIQIGGYSCMVGSHFWNLQDELLGYCEKEEYEDLASTIDHEMLFQLSEGRHGELSYRPRTLFVDLSGGMGGGIVSSSSAPPPQSIGTWGGKVEVHQADPIPRSDFALQLLSVLSQDDGDSTEEEREARQKALERAAMALEQDAWDSADSVRSWTDFLKAQVDAQSAYALPGVWKGINDFAGFGDGSMLMGGGGGGGGGGLGGGMGGGGGGGFMREAKEEMEDRIRVLAEQCDCLQGFQVLADDLKGFGSVSVNLLEELRDDYEGRDVLLFSVRQPHQGSSHSHLKGNRDGGQWLGASSSMSEIREACNEALATALIPDLCSLYVPISAPDPSLLPHLTYRSTNSFHTSAIIACAIDCITTPLRLVSSSTTRFGSPSGSIDLRSLMQILRGRGGGNLAAASIYLPCPTIPPDDTTAASHPSNSTSPDSRCQLLNAGTLDRSGGTGGMASMTPGIFGPSSSGDEEAQALSSMRQRVLSESICLKGAMHTDSTTCHVLRAQKALDAALLSSRAVGGGAMTRTVQQRSVAPMAIPIPLPFPTKMLTDHRTIDSYGQTKSYRISNSGGGGGGGGGGEPLVHTLPALTRLSSTMAFLPLLQQVVVDWKGAWRCPGGKALLDPWGYGSRGEAEEVEERLQQMVGEYQDVDED